MWSQPTPSDSISMREVQGVVGQSGGRRFTEQVKAGAELHLDGLADG